MEEKWMRAALYLKNDSTCVRRHVGAIIVKDENVIGYGANRVNDDIGKCTNETCIRKVNNIPSGTRAELCYAVHAEQNAIIDAVKKGNDVNGSTIYVSDSPCIICAKLLIAFGIKRIIYYGSYPDELSLDLIRKSNVELIRYENNINEEEIYNDLGLSLH